MKKVTKQSFIKISGRTLITALTFVVLSISACGGVPAAKVTPKEEQKSRAELGEEAAQLCEDLNEQQCELLLKIAAKLKEDEREDISQLCENLDRDACEDVVKNFEEGEDPDFCEGLNDEACAFLLEELADAERGGLDALDEICENLSPEDCAQVIDGFDGEDPVDICMDLNPEECHDAVCIYENGVSECDDDDIGIEPPIYLEECMFLDAQICEQNELCELQTIEKECPEGTAEEDCVVTLEIQLTCVNKSDIHPPVEDGCRSLDYQSCEASEECHVEYDEAVEPSDGTTGDQAYSCVDNGEIAEEGCGSIPVDTCEENNGCMVVTICEAPNENENEDENNMDELCHSICTETVSIQ